MKRIAFILLSFLPAMVLQAQIVVTPDAPIGPIKRMNAVNNGPLSNSFCPFFSLDFTGRRLDRLVR